MRENSSPEVTSLGSDSAPERRSDSVRALLDRKVRARLAVAAERSIPRRNEAGPVPASWAQERLWFLDRLVPGNPAYNVARAFALRGELDLDALARALRAVVDRHEVLRTTFAATDEGPVQVVAPESSSELAVVDLTGVAARAEAKEICRAEAARPFSLADGPLLRASVLRLSPRDHVLLLTLHHIVSDGWSMGILLREIEVCYAAAGKPRELPELPIQAADAAVWQRRQLTGDRLARLLEYWRGHLDGAPKQLELPTDRRRPSARVSAAPASTSSCRRRWAPPWSGSYARPR